jgi:hypothetical protein
MIVEGAGPVTPPAAALPGRPRPPRCPGAPACCRGGSLGSPQQSRRARRSPCEARCAASRTRRVSSLSNGSNGRRTELAASGLLPGYRRPALRFGALSRRIAFVGKRQPPTDATRTPGAPGSGSAEAPNPATPGAGIAEAPDPAAPHDAGLVRASAVISLIAAILSPILAGARGAFISAAIIVSAALVYLFIRPPAGRQRIRELAMLERGRHPRRHRRRTGNEPVACSWIGGSLRRGDEQATL